MAETKMINAHLQGADAIDQVYEPPVDVKNPAGYGLHQAFNKDKFEEPVTQPSKFPELQVQTPSFWSKVTPWWTATDVKIEIPTPSTSPQTEKLSITKTQSEPISSVPVLEAPESNPGDVAIVKPPRLSPTSRENSVEKLSLDRMLEGIALMSTHSIEQIMAIVLKAQLELEKENANVAEDTFSKFQDLKKLQEKTLQEIKDVLEKDERFVGYFRTAANIALGISFVTTAAAVAVTFGVTAPLVVILGTIGVAIAAGLTALTTGSEAYFKRRKQEDDAKHVRLKHGSEQYDRHIEEARERLLGIAEGDNAFKERLVQQIKRLEKMKKLMVQK